ncbi:uncharacterized protein [Venturia canescens]|uniref:uncharacterized protein n=1 Tax=Venturia canescens TaxID=32260 RepID=UPI001C9CFB9A|nr:uncharacterized protein LOC122412527 [Venturia canescens]
MIDEKNLEDFPKSTTLQNTNVGEEKLFFKLDVNLNGNDVKDITTSNNLYYDPQGMRPKSIICSEVISKTRLTTREVNFQNSTVRSPVESDEDFVEKLKKRIHGDRKKFETSKSEIFLPKRGSIIKKRRDVFNNESLHLIKKFRHEVLTRTDRLSKDHGIFSMTRKGIENEENFNGTNPLENEPEH